MAKQESIKLEDTDLSFKQDYTNQIDIEGVIETVSVVPTGKPTSLDGQRKIYKNGATRRYYWYDTLNDEWVYTAGTV